ncbi:hypothetical protein CVT24_012159, partial [Panaeolus cyanescens]
MPATSSTQSKGKFICDDCNRHFQKNQGLMVHQRSCAKKRDANEEFLASGSNSDILASQPRRKKKKSRLQDNHIDSNLGTATSQMMDVETGLSEKALGKRKASDTQDFIDAIPPQDAMDQTEDSPVSPAVDQHTMVPMDVDTMPQSAPSEAYVPPPTRRGRERRFPKRYDDFLPCTSTRIPHMPPPPPPPPPAEAPRTPTPPPLRPPSPTIGTFTTNVNEFGMYRVYPTLPSREVEENEELVNICDGPGFPTSLPTNLQWEKVSGLSKQPTASMLPSSEGVFGPFLNVTIFRLFRWFYTGSNM